MNKFEIKMPKLGESITEGTILSWSVKPGDHVQEDDILFEVSTAKVSAEIPSPIAGKVSEIFFQEGDTVAVGTIVATLVPDGEEEDSPEKQTEEKENAIPSAPKNQVNESIDNNEPANTQPADHRSASPQTGTQDRQPQPAQAKNNATDNRWYSPVVLQLAQAAGLSKEELDRIPGTGYMGRLSKKDIQIYIEKRKNGTPADQSNQPVSSPEAMSATPSQQTDKSTPPSITEKPKKNDPSQKAEKTATQPIASSNPSTDGDNEGNTIIEMDRVRRIIAEHMVRSKQVSPHVTSVIEVDVTPLVRWRSRIKDAFFKKEGIKLTYLPAIAEAVAKALTEYPTLNASVDGSRIILKKHINLGIAVSLPDGNLIVPVIHNADKLNLNGLAASIDTLATQARTNQLALDKMQGGTFTITNFGTFKSLFGTPIINQPEVAILAVGYIEKKPCVVETPEGDTIAIRHKMYLSLSYDHRIVDGALAGAFLRRIGDIIENWNA